MGFSPLGSLFLLSDRLATWEFACSAPRCRRRPSVVSDVASPLRVSASCRKGELSRACSHVALYPGGLSRVRILLTDITQHASVAEIVPHSGRSILQKRTWLLCAKTERCGSLSAAPVWPGPGRAARRCRIVPPPGNPVPGAWPAQKGDRWPAISVGECSATAPHTRQTPAVCARANVEK